MDLFDEMTGSNVSIEDLFRNIVAIRLLKSRRNGRDDNEYLVEYARSMLDFMVKYPTQVNDFLSVLNEYIVRILEDSVFYGMAPCQVVDSLSELSAYAAIFVFREKYSDTYEKICRKISDLYEYYPINEMNWEEAKKGYDEDGEMSD